MNRKAAEKFWLDVIRQLPDPKRNIEVYTEFFKTVTDDELRELKRKHIEEDFIFPIFVYNMDGIKFDVDQVIKVGESIGVVFFQHLNLTDHVSGQVYKTPVKYLVLEMSVRRQIQHLIKKMSVSEGRSVDHLAGQATGDTKAAGVSLPELTQIDARGLLSSPIELIKVKGGDDAAYKHMRQQMREKGGFSLAPIMELDSKPKAVETLKSFLLGRNLKPEGL
jgi:hypothetical protein